MGQSTNGRKSSNSAFDWLRTCFVDGTHIFWGDFVKYKVNRNGLRLAKLASLVYWNQFRYPQPTKGTYDIAGSTMEKLKWAYKCWVRQIEVAERGAGIEDHFAKQTLDFFPEEGFEETASVSLCAGGDLMAVDVLTEENTPYLFDGIGDFYFDADIVCANLESTVYARAPLGRNQVPGMPAKMNTSEGMLDRFLNGGKGINYFSVANNHCYDYCEEGLLATLDMLDRKGCWYSGTNRSPQAQEDVLIIEKNGVRIAMLSYTFDMNGNHYEKKHLINEVRFNDEIVDLSMVKRHIAKAREKGCDLVVASCHWGWEFEMYPHASVIKVAHTLADEGVDVILGSHPHVAQPLERYDAVRNGRVCPCLIAYSLGDFVSYHPISKNAKLSLVIRFQIKKGVLRGTQKTVLSDLEVYPVYLVAQDISEDACDCRLLSFQKVLDCHGSCGLSPEEKTDLQRLDKKVLRGILVPPQAAHHIVAPQK